MNGMFVSFDGVVGTAPRRSTWDGNAVTSFRMVTRERRWDPGARSWVDGHASWINVSCFRALAENVAESIHKGDRVLVSGKLRMKDWSGEDGVRRTSAELEAQVVGHNLVFGTARFWPTPRPEPAHDRLQEVASVLNRELEDEPEASVEELVAQRESLVIDDLGDEGPRADGPGGIGAGASERLGQPGRGGRDEPEERDRELDEEPDEEFDELTEGAESTPDAAAVPEDLGRAGAGPGGRRRGRPRGAKLTSLAG